MWIENFPSLVISTEQFLSTAIPTERSDEGSRVCSWGLLGCE